MATTDKSKIVWMLYHIRRVDKFDDDEKLIGIYSTRLRGKDAINQVRDKPGFASHPRGFKIFKCHLDHTGWTEGFITWQEHCDSIEPRT
jgi:hypothetical protein